MKKLVACIMVLAMVFSVSAGTLADDTQTGATPNTKVQFKVDNSQISVTLPVALAATVTASTGAIGWPEASAYQLVNNSAFAIKVSSITCSTEEGWTLAASGEDAITATVKAGSTGSPVTLSTTDTTVNGAEWNMGSRGTATSTLSLTLDGSIATPGAKTRALTATAATAFTITYTVAAGANT